MRMYRKNFPRNMMNKQIRSSSYDRDGIVWDIDTTNKLASVRIQGSNTNIKAIYSRVTHERPGFLKKGSCVRIRFKRGNHGYVEIIGEGRSIPTPVDGTSDLPVRSSVNAILSGFDITEINPLNMNYRVSGGTFRYNNQIYSFTSVGDEYYLMQDPPILVMGADPVVMGTSFGNITIPTAPAAGYGRYDLIVVGIDGIVDVVEGTPALLSVEPTMPSTPSGHVKINHIFIYAGQTEVDESMVGKNWSAPIAQNITAVISGDVDADDHVLLQDGATATIVLSATDQYGQVFDGNNATITMTLETNDGEVSGSLTGIRSDYAQSRYNSNVSFSYIRPTPASANDQSVALTFESDQDNFSYTLILVNNIT